MYGDPKGKYMPTADQEQARLGKLPRRSLRSWGGSLGEVGVAGLRCRTLRTGAQSEGIKEFVRMMEPDRATRGGLFFTADYCRIQARMA